jgi:hypothetical protein
MFNVGFEHGYMQGRRDTRAVLWRRTPRGRDKVHHGVSSGPPLSLLSTLKRRKARERVKQDVERTIVNRA